MTATLTKPGELCPVPVLPEAGTDNFSTTFNIVDWLKHTPRDIIAKNFGVDAAVFDKLSAPPGILNGTVATKNVTADADRYLSGNASFIYRTLQHEPEKVSGGGGSFWIIDSKNFPASKTIAATFVTLKPGGLRELHWHPNVCY
jgi:oxalate decarboxylase/phosphoglucose isomerase-like protein (cupin superfamily)